MDPLSEIFGMMAVRATGSARLAAGGDWAFRFSRPTQAKFGAVLDGHCWLQVGDGEAIPLGAGDCYLLTKPLGYVVASGPAIEPVDGASLYADGTGVARVGSGETILVGGGFEYDLGHALYLMDLLPPIVRVSGGSPAGEILRGTLVALDRELRSPGIGSAFLVERLAHILFIQALRAHLEQTSSARYGLLSGLADPRIGRVLSQIHAEPAHRWTVAELAAVAALSRSSFSERFRLLVGHAPLDYVLRWRMQLARFACSRSRDSVAAIARSAGYQSTSAFTAAFKRVHGVSIRDLRRG